MGYAHLGGNVFKVDDSEDVMSAYDEWLMNEMEDEDNEGWDLDVSSIPTEGYPLNVGFYRHDGIRHARLDSCKVELSDDEIHRLWVESGSRR